MKSAHKLTRLCLPVLVATALVLAMGSVAKADEISFDLTLGNSGLNGYAGPYAQVTVDLTTATSATITFAAYEGYTIGGAQAVDVNVNAASFSVGTPTEDASAPWATGYTPTLKQTPHSDSWLGSGNVDGFGSFNLTIDNFDGNKDSATTISFVLTDLSGTWSGASDVLANNTDGYPAAAHIFVCGPGGATTCDASVANPATGYATVPEPGSLMLFGTGLIGLAGFLRRKLVS